MRGIVLLLAAVAVVGVVLYARQTGSPPAVNGNVDPSRATEAVKGTWDWYFSQPWFYLSAAAGVLAMLGMMTWKRIGGWGRGMVLVIGAIAVTVWLVKS